jgi:hypothetical protein
MFGLSWPQSLPWIDVWRRAAALHWGYMERMFALPDPRQLRTWWLADLRRLADDYMRSPEFLALMRLNLTLLNQPMMIKAAQMMALPTR